MAMQSLHVKCETGSVMDLHSHCMMPYIWFLQSTVQLAITSLTDFAQILLNASFGFVYKEQLIVTPF